MLALVLALLHIASLLWQPKFEETVGAGSVGQRDLDYLGIIVVQRFEWILNLQKSLEPTDHLECLGLIPDPAQPHYCFSHRKNFRLRF